MSTLPFPKQFIVDVFIFILVIIPLLFLQALGKPAVTGFWCHDKSLSYPYKTDTVSLSMLMLFSFAGPFFVMALVETIRAAFKVRLFRQFRNQMMSLAKAYGVFLFGMAATCIFTDTTKYWVGRLRPHFFDICRPDFDKINCTADFGTDRFIEMYTCTNTLVDDKLIQDSHLSFPSGHASMSMYSAVFTIMSMLLLAVFCCVTRVTDHKHFLSDVIAGSAVGVCLAWGTFYRIGHAIIPTKPAEKPRGLPRAISIESEPQTPTPLLRPERLVISHGYRNKSGPEGKEDFVHKV